MVLNRTMRGLAEPWGVLALRSGRETGTQEGDGQGAARERSETPGESGVRSQILSILLSGSCLCWGSQNHLQIH